LKATEREARAELVSQARRIFAERSEGWLDGLFGQRGKSETVISVLKRKFGEGVRSRKPRLQVRECRVKVFVYNAYR